MRGAVRLSDCDDSPDDVCERVRSSERLLDGDSWMEGVAVRFLGFVRLTVCVGYDADRVTAVSVLLRDSECSLLAVSVLDADSSSDVDGVT